MDCAQQRNDQLNQTVHVYITQMRVKLYLALILVCNIIACILMTQFDTLNPRPLLAYFSPQNKYDLTAQVQVHESYPWHEYLAQSDFSADHQSIINQSDYCSKVRAFFLKNPIEFDAQGLPLRAHRRYFSDYPPGNLLKKTIENTGTLLMKQHHIKMNPQDPNPIDPSINMFMHKTSLWHQHHKIGTHFLCEGQKYNHIPGMAHITNKDVILQHYKDYQNYYAGRESCLPTFLPETYDLSDTTQCESITRQISEDQSRTIRWIKKIARNSHNASGITLMTHEAKLAFLAGNVCSRDKAKVIIQSYVDNPLLINGKKFDFRVYFLIASMDPIILLYHDGFLRFSMSQYDETSDSTFAHITNTNLAKKESKAKNNDQEILNEQMWSFARFEQYLVDAGIVEENWLRETMVPMMKAKMMHLFRMTFYNLLRHPGVFELLGVDFLIDSDLNMWFLEANKSPSMQGTTQEKKQLMTDMVTAIVDLEFALLYGGDFDTVLDRSEFEMIYDGRSDTHYSLSSNCIQAHLQLCRQWPLTSQKYSQTCWNRPRFPTICRPPSSSSGVPSRSLKP